MKNLLILVLLSTIFNTAFAADKEKARNITNQLNQWIEPQKSTTPNAAILYISNANNVDDTQFVTAVPLLDNDIVDGQIVIQRPTEERFALTRCNVDLGTAQPFLDGNPRIVVNTTSLPVRVFCSTDDGRRVFYTTVFDSSL